MEFDSPDVEKDFPGLYMSETGEKAKKNKEDSDCKYNLSFPYFYDRKEF